MKSVIALAVLALAVVCLAEDKMDCKDVFNPVSKEHKEAAESCKKPEAKPPKDKEEFIKSGYDDQCAAHCTFEKLKMLKGDDLDKDAIMKDVSKLVKNKDAMKRVEAFTEECLKKAEALTDIKSKCSRPAFFVNCILEGQENMCLPNPTPSA